ncbi:MAG TPA: DUF3240 family protein [Rhodocyclaceae bacterium]
MQNHPKKLLVIIAEAALEKLLVEDILRLGAHGYTVLDARGDGTRGKRQASWEGDSSIRVEVICDEATAERIADHVSETYFTNYAVTLYVADVRVQRSSKF